MNSPHCAANPLSGLSYNCVTGLSYTVTDRGRVFFPEGHADRTVWHEISTGVPSQRTWTCHVVITQHREVSSILRLWEPEGLLFCCCFDGGSLWVVNIWPWARHSLLNPRILTCKMKVLDQVTSIIVQSLSHVRLFVTPWTAVHQASLSFTISRSLLQLMSIESVMPSNHLILCQLFSSCLQSFPAH